MITEQDLTAAIAECQGTRNPDAHTCIMLAAFYTIMEHMYPEAQKPEAFPSTQIQEPGYSYASPPETYAVSLDSGTDFARLIDGKSPDEIMPVLDEAMSILQVAYPKLYNVIMDRLR